MNIRKIAVGLCATAFLASTVYGFSQSQAQAATREHAVSEAGLPPGTRIDTNITPRASRSASNAAKTAAVLAVARSKLGTPYIWGHNEDRGQYGFDCSNFTAYVYHHALGYVISTASRVQYTSVGWNVPKADVKAGDLVIFNDGSHVGIYVNNDIIIQDGGGKQKVAYLSIAKNTYWGHHISAIRRMY